MTHPKSSPDQGALTRKSQDVQDARSAPLVAALERAWQAIRTQHPEVPHAVLIVGSGTSARTAGMALGHFAAQRWEQAEDEAIVHEVQIGGEGLRLGAEEVLATLLHEAAHALAVARGVQDTSRQGRYHNKRFRSLATELGLQITEAPGIGWSDTALPASTAALYRGTLDDLRDAITLHRRPEAYGPPAPSRNPVAAVCGCARRIRVAPSTLDAGPIVCSLCNTPFERTSV